MGQPVKRVISETHADMIKGKDEYTLLIDGNSLLFFSFADTKTNSDGIHYGGIFQFLLQMKMMMSKRAFDYVYVFFDDEYSGWMRWNLYKPYKANRDKNYQSYGMSDYMKSFNENLKGMQKAIFGRNNGYLKDIVPKSDSEKFIDENFDRERDTLMKYFEELYVRCYMDEIVEGDDLIAYYCQHKNKNEKIYIMSGDMDLCQLLAEDIAIYNLNLKKFITIKNFQEEFGYSHENILAKKILCGDNSDNIGNIKLLSENKLKEIIPEYTKKKVTIDDVKEKVKELMQERIDQKKKPLQVYENIINGVSNKMYDGDFYEINEKIINLKNPLLSDNAIDVMESMIHAPIDPEGRSFKNLYSYILEDNIEEFNNDTKFASFFNVFKQLEMKEKSRYNESLKN